MPSIELKGGLLVAVEAVVLALHLEDRGLVLSRRGDRLCVEKGATCSAESLDSDKKTPILSPSEVDQIRNQKTHLLAIVDYCEANH